MSIEENPFVDSYNFCCPPTCPDTVAAAASIDYLVTQVAHGFDFGNVLKCIDTDTYALAKADNAADCEVVGIVSEIVDADHFWLKFIGNLEGFTGLTPATTYFLSDDVAGELTTIEPFASGSISKPLLIAHSSTAGFFFNFRGIFPGLGDGGGGTPLTVDTDATGDFADAGSVSDVSTLTFNSDIFRVRDNGSGEVQVTIDPALINPLSFGNLTDAGTDGITITGGTGAVIGSGTSIAQHVADSTHNGYLSSTDWVSFNTPDTFDQDRTVTLFADGAGTLLIPGIKNPIKVPFSGELQGWTMTCIPSGSITIDVLRSADGTGLPVTSIVGGGTMPSISTDVENSSTDFSGWTSTTITANDNLAVSLSGITSATYCALTLYYK